jgi:pimeloyl-ACP methyl ester carboxylesterase
MSCNTFTLSNGRKLGYAIEGEGDPVIYFHGTASSRLEILLLKQFVNSNYFKLIGVDRPGYGLSTFAERVRLEDFAYDVNALADHLKLDKFGVLSWSGGGPFALAYIALFPLRTTKAVIVGSPSLPFDSSSAHNGNPFVKVAMKNHLLAECALKFFRSSILKASEDIDGYIKSRGGKSMIAERPNCDQKFFSDPAWLTLMYQAMAEAFRQKSSPKTIFQEHKLFLQPWYLPPLQVPPRKIKLWQGGQDTTCPNGNAKRIAQIFKVAHIEYFPEDGHCVMFAKLQKLSNDLRQQ